MALSGLEIYKQLPKTNCGDCGVPTCLAFAMKLAAGGTALDACPHVTEEAKATLSEASAPPMAGVTIGTGENALKVGEELVLFRHEKTFFNPPGLALLLEDTLGASEIGSRLETLKKASFDRVGQMLKADLAAIKCASGDGAVFAEAAKAASAGGFPLVLACDNPAAMRSALEAVGSDRPLIYAATPENADGMIELAKDFSCPLALKAGSLEDLAALSEKATGAGVKDLMLDPGTRGVSETLKSLVFMRRAALKKKFRPFGFPTIAMPAEETDDEMVEALYAGVYIMKYGGVIVMKGMDAWKALPLYVLRQNIYTDPQRPMQVTEGIYEFNSPGPDAPVLLTTNFSLTYFIVSSEIETSKQPAYLAVVDAEGLSVLTAWAAGKFGAERIAKFVATSGLAEKISHKTIVIPGYVAQISGELEEELPDWKIKVGPREATEIPAYVKNWSLAEVG
ncbi:MAG: acetyl-CoA decarbonylase/synthase complex subunit gamma [Candidatus Aquicultorales bacterium]